jgi:antitoxin CptB
MSLDRADLDRLRWRCRRGLLENDLLIERWFHRVQASGETLTERQATGLMTLMDLADNDLLDLLLARTEPHGDVDTPEAREVLAQMRPAPLNATEHA